MALPLDGSPSLLRPVIALNIWTFAMQIWMYAVRQPAIKRYKIKYTPQTKLADFYAKIPPEAQWPGDNFNNLMEQPTQFYALAISMALLHDQSEWSAGLAWVYVALRVVHSVIHAKVNNVTARGRTYTLSSVVLLMLGLRAAWLTVR